MHDEEAATPKQYAHRKTGTCVEIIAFNSFVFVFVFLGRCFLVLLLLRLVFWRYLTCVFVCCLFGDVNVCWLITTTEQSESAPFLPSYVGHTCFECVCVCLYVWKSILLVAGSTLTSQKHTKTPSWVELSWTVWLVCWPIMRWARCSAMTLYWWRGSNSKYIYSVWIEVMLRSLSFMWIFI